MKKLFLVMLVAIFVFIGANSAQAILYTPWTDVQKYAYGQPPGLPIDPSIDPGDITDTLMCWAAASSNVLMYTGWGFDRDHDGTIELYDDLYHEFLYAYPNAAGLGSTAYNHYLTTFYPGLNYLDYFRQENDKSKMLASIDAWLADGYGIYLSVDGHAITAWGYETDPVTGVYNKIYVTDSDDPLVGGYQTYDIWFASNMWYIDITYWGIQTINRIDAFGPRSVPEPSTLILLGSGLIGLGVIVRRKLKRD